MQKRLLCRPFCRNSAVNMDFWLNRRPEKRTMRRACGLQSRCVGPWAANGRRTDGGFCRPPPRAGIMPWAANMPCGRKRFGRRTCLGRLTSLLKVWGGEHILRGDRRGRRTELGRRAYLARDTFRAAAAVRLSRPPYNRRPSRNRPEIRAARRVLSERRKNKRRFC